MVMIIIPKTLTKTEDVLVPSMQRHTAERTSPGTASSAASTGSDLPDLQIRMPHMSAIMDMLA